MELGRRTKATARAIGAKVDKMASVLGALAWALVVLTVAVAALALRVAA